MSLRTLGPEPSASANSAIRPEPANAGFYTTGELLFYLFYSQIQGDCKILLYFLKELRSLKSNKLYFFKNSFIFF